MKRYTIADILAWHPCERYTEATLRELFGRRRSVTLLDILFADIPDADAIWAACRAMDARQRRHFACDCAESVLHLANDPRSTEAVRVSRLYADGFATDAELSAAYVAARDSASYAAWSAWSAVAASYAAAWSAADAAWSAADAAWSAADAATAAAATYAVAADAAATTVAATDAAVAASVAAAASAASAAASAACAASDAADARGDQRQALIMLVLSGEIK